MHHPLTAFLGHKQEAGWEVPQQENKLDAALGRGELANRANTLAPSMNGLKCTHILFEF